MKNRKNKKNKNIQEIFNEFFCLLLIIMITIMGIDNMIVWGMYEEKVAELESIKTTLEISDANEDGILPEVLDDKEKN